MPVRKPIDGPYVLKQGDTAPPIYILCEDENGPAILTGVLVGFRMRQVDGTKLVIGAAAAVNSTAIDPHPDAGWVRYDLQADGTDTNVPGLFRAEVRVTYAPGTPQQAVETFPSEDYVDIIIRPNLA